jgi:hypothetical protein
MGMSLGGRSRAALVAMATLGLTLAAAAPATAATTGPPTPIDLFNGDLSCSTNVASPTYVSAYYGLTAEAGVQLEGLSQDTNSADSPFITEQFQVWPVSDPTQTTTLSNTTVLPEFEGTVTMPAADLSDGQTYAWQVQAVGASGTSAFTAPCYFAVDNTAPANPPTITSANYPQGQLDQGGAPVQVTLGANGVSDVQGYVFTWVQPLPVAVLANVGAYGIPQPVDNYADTTQFALASTLGGSATVNLIPPPGSSGPMTLTVASLDRALNESPAATYSFDVGSTAPTIRQLDPHPKFDQKTEFQITPNPGLQAASRVVSYTVQFTGQTEQTFTVKASASGQANVSVTLDGATGDVMFVSSTSADGWVSGNAFWSYNIDTTPAVSSNVYLENESSGGVGIPGTFTFAPKVAHVVSYTYSFNSGPAVTVEAGGNGVAKISFTPDQSGFYDLNVYATTKDGLALTPYDYFFTVN